MLKLSRAVARLFGRNKDVSVPPFVLSSLVDGRRLLPLDRTMWLGTRYGGWRLPVDHGLDAHSICYLAGAGEDISFDCALANATGARIRIMDPTPRSVKHFDELSEAVRTGSAYPVNGSPTERYAVTRDAFSKMTFLPFGLSDADTDLRFYMPANPAHVSCSAVNLHGTSEYFTAKCHTLRSIMAAVGDEKVDLLKIDIEGSEYAVIDDLLANGPLPGLMLVEFDEVHSPTDAGALDRISLRIQALQRAGYSVIAVDDCNVSFCRTIADT